MNFLNSKPVMDLLVTLCASYHLNPSDYTVAILSANKNNISFKPNSPIGSLEAEKIVLKPKGVEEKIRRPYMPEVRKKKGQGCFYQSKHHFSHNSLEVINDFSLFHEDFCFKVALND